MPTTERRCGRSPRGWQASVPEPTGLDEPQRLGVTSCWQAPQPLQGQERLLTVREGSHDELGEDKPVRADLLLLKKVLQPGLGPGQRGRILRAVTGGARSTRTRVSTASRTSSRAPSPPASDGKRACPNPHTPSPGPGLMPPPAGRNAGTSVAFRRRAGRRGPRRRGPFRCSFDPTSTQRT